MKQLRPTNLCKVIATRLRCLWLMKLVGTVACTAGFLLLYFAAQRLHLREPIAVPSTWVDEWVAFDPRWTLVYESLWLMLPIAAWLAGRPEHIRRHLLGFGLMCGVAFPVFFLWPVDAPRPSVLPDHTLYLWLVAIDGTRNSIPSMHAALGAYTLLVTCEMLHPLMRRGQWWTVASLGLCWLLAILYATLATAQHWFVDLPPGVLLGGVAYLVVWRALARVSLKGLLCDSPAISPPGSSS